MADHSGYTGGKNTGFVSPTGDALEGTINLPEIFDLHRPSRYLIQVAGNALVFRGILSNDILVVDAAVPPAQPPYPPCATSAAQGPAGPGLWPATRNGPPYPARQAACLRSAISSATARILASCSGLCGIQRPSIRRPPLSAT